MTLSVADLERKSASKPRSEIEFEFGVEVRVVFEVVVEFRLFSRTRAPTSVVDDFWAKAASQNNGGDIIVSTIYFTA